MLFTPDITPRLRKHYYQQVVYAVRYSHPSHKTFQHLEFISFPHSPLEKLLLKTFPNVTAKINSFKE